MLHFSNPAEGSGTGPGRRATDSAAGCILSQLLMCVVAIKTCCCKPAFRSVFLLRRNFPTESFRIVPTDFQRWGLYLTIGADEPNPKPNALRLRWIRSQETSPSRFPTLRNTFLWLPQDTSCPSAQRCRCGCMMPLAGMCSQSLMASQRPDLMKSR
jgi:hypothetical protein